MIEIDGHKWVINLQKLMPQGKDKKKIVWKEEFEQDTEGKKGSEFWKIAYKLVKDDGEIEHSLVKICYNSKKTMSK